MAFKIPRILKKEARNANSVYVAIAGEVINRKFMLLRNFVLNGQVSASNPLLHIHAKRYAQAEKRQRHSKLTMKTEY